VQISTVQISAVQISTVQISTVQISTVQLSTVQISTVHICGLCGLCDVDLETLSARDRTLISELVLASILALIEKQQAGPLQPSLNSGMMKLAS
jgi:hypothetical protein